MARVFTEGAEMGDTKFFDYDEVSMIVSTTKRSGTYSYETSGTASGKAQHNISAVSEFYIRMCCAFKACIGSGVRFLAWYKGSTEMGSLRCAANNFISIYSGTSAVATAIINPINRSYNWYVIEAHVKIGDSPNGIVEVKVDGISTVSYTGDTKPGADTTVDVINFQQNGWNGMYYLDDIALNDTSGGADNSWCGDGRVILLKPDADGDSSTWVGSDGNSTNNYALVDDIPPSSTDYVEASSSGDTDLYNLAACGLSSVNILRVWPEARAADTVAEGGQIYLPIKIGGTQYDGTAVTLLTTYTNQLIGDVRTVNPYNSSAWSTSDLDSLQVGVKVV